MCKPRGGAVAMAALVAIAVLPAPACAAPNAWTVTGSLGLARTGHSATVLQNGKVLAVGGYNDAAYHTTAELFDPAAGAWSFSTRSMHDARGFHTATLLAGGKVLIAGGYSAVHGGFAAAEVYNPAVDDFFTTTNSMSSLRNEQAAVRLGDGRVLEIGGNGGDGPVDSVDVYAPAADSFAAATPMATKRLRETATLLASGKVLVAGGFSDPGATASAELYDPATGTWSPAGTMGQKRFGHTATLLPSGKVLVAGGFSALSTPVRSAELYDPATNSWSPTADMASARGGHGAALVGNGLVLVAGGSGPSALAGAELYDPAGARWLAGGSMTQARADLFTTSLLADGRVLVAGGAASSNGLSPSGDTASAELYSPPQPPDAPGAVSAAPGDRSATATWTAPPSNGGLAVTGYTVTASPGGAKVTAGPAARRASVPGLQDGKSYTLSVAATTPAGTGAARAAAPVTPSRAAGPGAPVVSRLRLSPRAFRAAAHGPSLARAAGARIRYSLSKPAVTHFRVELRASGRRVGRRCVGVTKRNRRGGVCVRRVRVKGGFSHRDRAGPQSSRFSGRVRGRKLRPGRYFLVARARDAAGEVGVAKRAAFRVLRP